MTRIEILDDKGEARWDEYVNTHPLASVYHTTAWKRVLETSYRFKPIYLYETDRSGDILGALPLALVRKRRLVSLPVTQFVDPLVQSPEQLHRFRDFIDRKAGLPNFISCELRMTEDFPFHHHFPSDSPASYTTHDLSLCNDLDGVFRSFHKSCIQRAIRKAQQSSLIIKAGTSLDDIKDVYQLYVNMRRQNGLLPQPFVFFRAIAECFPSGRLLVLRAYNRGTLMAAILVLRFGTKAYYEYGASAPLSRQLRASHLLLWEAIRRLHTEGYKIFNFGRTGYEKKGLMEFKSRWGTRAIDLVYHRAPQDAACGRWYENARMQMVATAAIRRLPPSICRASGRILYRHLL